MTIFVYLLLAFCCLLLQIPVIAQKRDSSIQKAEKTNQNIRLNKNKPHVYISHEREGKIDPLYVGESGNRIWLRLHNNSKWIIMFCSSVISKEYGDAEVEYKIERYKGFGDAPETRSSDSCGYILIKSGKTLLFSIPREHLANGLAIKIQFRYQWENDEDGSDDLLEPKHFVYFYSEDIPNKQK
jgi:hypothetical protein